MKNSSCQKHYKDTKALSMKYTEKGSDTYCFFKYFFRSIGIWAGEWYGYKLVEPVCIPETCDREEFLRTELLPITGNLEEILDLFHIFADTNAWGAFWLAEELDKFESSIINNYIFEVCENIKGKIHESCFSTSWHHQYLELYCDRILTKINQKMMNCEDYSDLSGPLFKRMNKLKKEYADNPAGIWLTAKICEIFPTEICLAVWSYHDMITIPYYISPEILCSSAMIYI